MTVNCTICGQPFALGEATSNTHNSTQAEHAFRKDCVRAVARRCAEIAEIEQTEELSGEPVESKAAYRSACSRIRVLVKREFGL